MSPVSSMDGFYAIPPPMGYPALPRSGPDAPIACQALISGVEPGAVAVGEVLVGPSSEFELADCGWP